MSGSVLDLAASGPDPAAGAASTTTSVLPGETGSSGGSPRGTGQDGVSPAGSASDQALPAASPCGCPTGPGRTVTDLAAHNGWHALVLEQGGPAGAVNAVTLRGSRGFKTETLQVETLLDERARKSGKRANGKLRRAARDD